MCWKEGSRATRTSSIIYFFTNIKCQFKYIQIGIEIWKRINIIQLRNPNSKFINIGGFLNTAAVVCFHYNWQVHNPNHSLIPCSSLPGGAIGESYSSRLNVLIYLFSSQDITVPVQQFQGFLSIVVFFPLLFFILFDNTTSLHPNKMSHFNGSSNHLAAYSSSSSNSP